MARIKLIKTGCFTTFINEVEVIRPTQAKLRVVQQNYRKVIKPNYK